MESMHYVGLDVHKKTVSYCVKKVDGSLVSEGKIPATMTALSEWSSSLPKPWSAAMEATIFSGRNAPRLCRFLAQPSVFEAPLRTRSGCPRGGRRRRGPALQGLSPS